MAVIISCVCSSGKVSRASAPGILVPLDSTIITDPFTGANAEDRDRKTLQAFQKDLADLPKTDPKTAAAKYAQFLQDHPSLSPMVGIDAATALGGIYRNDVKDNGQALAIYDWGLKKWSDFPATVSLLNERAKILVAQGKAGEAEATFKDRLPQILHGWPQYANEPLDQYSQMLQDHGKSDETVKLLGQFLVLQPAYLDPGPPNWDWVYPRIVDVLLQQQKPQEAIRWAKMRFIMAAYDPAAIDRASRLLAQVWTADPNGGVALTAFEASQKDSTAHNPLAGVKLPDLDAVALKEQLAGRTQAADHISILILSGDLKAAMSEAQKMQDNKDTAKQGILQVCRVFKAADLNLKRANAYLAYLKSGQGDDPVEVFLKQAPP